MLRNLVLLVALFVVTVVSAQEMRRIQLPVTSVTVFANGAQVNMTGKIALPEGKSEVLVGGITGSLIEGTLQAVATGNVLIVSIVREENKTNGVYASDIQQKMKLIEILKDSLEINKMQIEVLENEKEVLLLNRQIGGNEGVKTAELKQLTDFMVTRLTEISRQIYRCQKTVTRLEKQKQKAGNELLEIRNRQQQAAVAVKLLIETKAALTTDLTLSYMVTEAGWYPLYDIRLPEEGNEAKLVSRAKVWQKTGVDWNNATLVLSSGNPQGVRDVPVMYPYYLRNEPRLPYAQNVMNTALLRKASGVAVTDVMDAGIQEEEEVVETGTRPMATQTQNMNQVDYTIRIPYTIPSGLEGTEVQIASLEVPVAYEYIVVPRISQEALLVVSIADFSRYNLPDGEVSLYLGNSYRGTQMINRNARSSVNDVLNLSMGSEKGIVVKRVPKQNFRKMTGGTVREQKLWETTIRNNKGIPVKIKVEDQYPLSQDDKIKVEELTYTRENVEIDTTTGKITWKITLQPKEVLPLSVGYTVKYPKDWEVQVR